MARQRILIQPVGFEAPIAKAAQELAAYLPRLAAVTVVALPQLAGVPKKCDAHIIVGASDHLSTQGLGKLPPPDLLDDALAIVPKDSRLYLVGSNPRSALFAVYRLLEYLGVVFLRPGPGGEALPARKKRLPLPAKALRETASYRHRGMCIEGSTRLELVLEVLDWMAKKKMNAFQLQFQHAGTFWKRGYVRMTERGRTNEVDEMLRAGDLSEADCYALDDRVIAHMKHIGLTLHRVGHGWTAAALGYSGGIGWEDASVSPSPEKQALMAEVNGVRGLYEGKPLNTELCYSNPAARDAFREAVMSYARAHSEVDCLHIWLSDAPNNLCECASCRKKPPTDWYLTLINEIGAQLKAELPQMRLVFLVYHDLLWPPAKVKLTVDNVIVMYAPITRCYQHALADVICDDGLAYPRPPLNKAILPEYNRPLADIIRAWATVGVTDSFVFDYHMWRAVWADGFGYDLGTIMAQDMRDLASLGMGGLISCQEQRAFYPLPYLANAMADVLWNRNLPRAAHRRTIMSAAFGKHAPAVEQSFATLIRFFRIGDTSKHETIISTLCPEHRGKLTRLAAFARAQSRYYTKVVRSERNRTIKLSLELFAMHLRNTGLIARIYLAGLDGDSIRIECLQAGFEAKQPGLLRKYAHWIDPLMNWPVHQAVEAARTFSIKAAK